MEENNGNTSLGNEEANQATETPETPEEKVDWEARFKGLQKSVQDKSLEVKGLRAQNEALAQQLNSITTPKVEVPEEVDELKYSDPESWRREINKLEQEALEKTAAERREILEAAEKEAVERSELDRRKEVFAEFQVNNPGLELNDDVITNDVPPRISRKLENGEVTFEEYLEEVKTFLTAGQKVIKEPTMGETSLGNVAGGSSPSEAAKRGQAKASYSNDIY